MKVHENIFNCKDLSSAIDEINSTSHIYKSVRLKMSRYFIDIALPWQGEWSIPIRGPLKGERTLFIFYNSITEWHGLMIRHGSYTSIGKKWIVFYHCSTNSSCREGDGELEDDCSDFIEIQKIINKPHSVE